MNTLSIVFLGSCQTEFLATQFKKISPPNTNIIPIVNWSYIQKKLPVPDELWKADILIYQPYFGKNDFNTENITKRLLDINPKIKFISFAFCDFSLYTPNHTYHPKDQNSSKYPFRKFGNIPTPIIGGIDLNDMIDRMNNEIPLKNLIDDQFKKLEERDSKCSIKISNFIYENWRSKRLFHIREHPTNILMSYIAEQIMNDLGWSQPLSLDRALDSSISIISPCYKKEFNLTFEIDQVKWYNGPSVSVEEYLKELSLTIF